MVLVIGILGLVLRATIIPSTACNTPLIPTTIVQPESEYIVSYMSSRVSEVIRNKGRTQNQFEQVLQEVPISSFVVARSTLWLYGL
jgi:hypothetical protein